MSSAIERTFRVDQVAGLFDLPTGTPGSAGTDEDRSVERFSVEVPGLGPDDPWQIGAIVGPSGSGKSTVARHVFGDALASASDATSAWPTDRAVVDGFDADLSMQAVTGMLHAVGFSSPPAWVRPYRALSNGQRFRCDLARALLKATPIVAYDEFTSVVDRPSAQVASACVARAVRRGTARCRRFVAVTCHYDVLDWLEPDWVLDMASGELARGRLRRRPAVHVEVRRCGRDVWRTFVRHHYLSGSLHVSARCHLATWEGRPAGFCATLQNMGYRGRRRIHRLVVLPDYQGLGIGTRLATEVARLESNTAVVTLRTGHPGLIASLGRSPRWRAFDVTRLGGRQSNNAGSSGRCTVGFAYRRERRNAMKDRTRANPLL
ncbi:MAG: GNAT family N-acetyltransferase [Planctomycetota bacterium]|nr:GNAT family N-acetyltransferase [Planctomycetota bacterium]